MPVPPNNTRKSTKNLEKVLKKVPEKNVLFLTKQAGCLFHKYSKFNILPNKDGSTNTQSSIFYLTKMVPQILKVQYFT
jgi:hypothetical protein